MTGFKIVISVNFVRMKIIELNYNGVLVFNLNPEHTSDNWEFRYGNLYFIFITYVEYELQ